MRSLRWGWSTCVRMIRQGCRLMLRSHRSAWRSRLAPGPYWPLLSATIPSQKSRSLEVIELGDRPAVRCSHPFWAAFFLAARRLRKTLVVHCSMLPHTTGADICVLPAAERALPLLPPAGPQRAHLGDGPHGSQAPPVGPARLGGAAHPRRGLGCRRRRAEQRGPAAAPAAQAGGGAGGAGEAHAAVRNSCSTRGACGTPLTSGAVQSQSIKSNLGQGKPSLNPYKPQNDLKSTSPKNATRRGCLLMCLSTHSLCDTGLR